VASRTPLSAAWSLVAEDEHSRISGYPSGDCVPYWYVPYRLNHPVLKCRAGSLRAQGLMNAIVLDKRSASIGQLRCLTVPLHKTTVEVEVVTTFSSFRSPELSQSI